MAKSQFEERLKSLNKLKRIAWEDFYVRYEEIIMDFLREFRDKSSQDSYQSLARNFYHRILKQRMLPFSGNGWLSTAESEELLKAQAAFRQYFDFLHQIPYFSEIVPDHWLHRYRAIAKALEARIAIKHKSSFRRIVRLLEQAANELESIANVSNMDLANATRYRADIARHRGSRHLRADPVPNLEMALREFRIAIGYAKRGQRLLRKDGKDVRSRHILTLRYWVHVAAIGLLPFQHRFSAAIKHCSLAAEYAARLTSISNKKWYASVEDVKNQVLLIRAYEALLQNHSLSDIQSLLSEWVQKSAEIADSGRYLRVLVRKYAIDILVRWQVDKSNSARAVSDLDRVIKSRRSFGLTEIYIGQVMNSLLGGIITYDSAIEAIASVFILDARPPADFRYTDWRP